MINMINYIIKNIIKVQYWYLRYSRYSMIKMNNYIII